MIDAFTPSGEGFLLRAWNVTAVLTLDISSLPSVSSLESIGPMSPCGPDLKYDTVTVRQGTRWPRSLEI